MPAGDTKGIGAGNEKAKTEPSIVSRLMENLQRRDGHKKEFLQCAEEILTSLEPLFQKDSSLIHIAERLLEPERAIQFRVAWVDDKGVPQVNRGWRIQYSSAIGPFKGGLRFHPSVSTSVLEFLGLEQIFKNSLTGLPMGGAKGGSDFDPKGKSDNEVMRFCQHFMMELYRHIGASIDVPAGDIGVGGREIGYLFGAYHKLSNQFEGVLTGKSLSWGGSLLRPEATGYGLVFFAAEAVSELKKTNLKGKRCLVSGSGNVALHTVEQLLLQGAVPLTMSDSGGFILEPDGFTKDQLAHVKRIKEVERGRIDAYLKVSKTAQYFADKKLWGNVENCDYAFPCATQNEIDEKDAEALIKSGCSGVFEGANMPCTNEAIKVYHEKDILFGPSKACNAGGVAVSGLEMSQNSMRLTWTAKEVEDKLKEVMKTIFVKCKTTAEEYGRPGDLQFGANVAGFLKVAGAMKDQGVL
jgi:glutamate dehydrogenase (NADP+)